MPKLRHGETDVGKFANWLGRKIMNHNPLAELTKSSEQRQKTPNIYASKTKGRVHEVHGDESTVLCEIDDGRAYKVTVEEISAEEFAAFGQRLKKPLR